MVWLIGWEITSQNSLNFIAARYHHSFAEATSNEIQTASPLANFCLNWKETMQQIQHNVLGFSLQLKDCLYVAVYVSRCIISAFVHLSLSYFTMRVFACENVLAF